MSSTQHSFCAVPLPTLVYAGPSSRQEFDRIPLPVSVGEWKDDSSLSLLKGDGKAWQRQISAKVMDPYYTGCSTGITVIFQWFDERPAPVAPAQPEPTDAGGCAVAEAR